jgi:hypothetical protein
MVSLGPSPPAGRLLASCVFFFIGMFGQTFSLHQARRRMPLDDLPGPSVRLEEGRSSAALKSVWEQTSRIK